METFEVTGNVSLRTEHSIRLLKIVRTAADEDAEPTWDDSLICTNTQDALEYETLSYVWGTPNRNTFLKVSDGTLLPITETLNQALPHIADTCTTGYLWIDQICIDQDNISERAQQVSIMGDIYSDCTRVLLRLGRLHSLSAKLASQCSLLDHKVSRPRLPPCTKCDVYHNACHQCAGEIFADIFCCRPGKRYLIALCHEVIESAWFSRGWVFQEVVLPRKSAFILTDYKEAGLKATIVLRTLYALCSAAWKYRSPNMIGSFVKEREKLITTSRYGLLKEMYDRWEERHRASKPIYMPLDQLLSLMSARARTSTAHDQLYAFVGINQNHQIQIVPSYQAPLRDALVATARSIIEGTSSLERSETLPRKTISRTLASWVPDFTAPRLPLPFVTHSTSACSPDPRTGIYPWCGRCDGATLWVHGTVVAVMDLCMLRQISSTLALSNSSDAKRFYNGVLLEAFKTWRHSRHCNPNIPRSTLKTILQVFLARRILRTLHVPCRGHRSTGESHQRQWRGHESFSRV
jgi:hypothetical protein